LLFASPLKVQTFVGTESQPAVNSGKAALQPPSTSRLSSLDGWRAVSILMVLGDHNTYASGFPSALKPITLVFFDGGLGVRFFFIISGFLITWLMMLEKDKTGSVSLREFYIRRCLRILPIYIAYLTVLAILQLSGLDRETPSAWLGNLTFTRNTFGYVNEGDALSAHLWSLSVEEQFYLAWPLLFVWLGKRGDRTILGILAAAILALTAIRGINFLSYYPLPHLKPFFHWHSLRSFDCLALGCACAVLFAHYREPVERCLKRHHLLTAVVGLAMVLFTFYSMYFPLKPVALAELVPVIRAVGFCILLLHSIVAPEWGFYRALNWSWVRRIGIWSYSIYIWQQLFWAAPPIWGLDRVWWMGIWILPLFAVTMISYYGLERPFFTLRSHHREVKFRE
jgi:peptidoglycan/LPS O-acetylase OafA/YrhL